MWRASDHVLVCGTNGTGKTTLAVRLVQDCAGVAILDSKGAGDFDDLPRCTHGRDVAGILRHDRYVWHPAPGAPAKDLDAFFAAAFRRGHVVVLVDEALHCCTASVIPRGYRSCLVSGRGRGIQVVSLTQRATGLHNDVLAESWWYVLFRQAGTDLAKLSAWGLTPAQAAEAGRLKKHAYLVWQKEDGQIVSRSG